MEIKIGISNIGRELSVETESSPEDILNSVNQALAEPNGVLRIDGERGRVVLIPASQLGYVELGTEQQRHVGFAV